MHALQDLKLNPISYRETEEKSEKNNTSFGLIISALVSCSSVCISLRRTSCEASLLNLTVFLSPD